MYRRDKHLLTTHTLTNYIDNNNRLNEIFNLEDPDQIANILLSELNIIINCIAPAKKIQCKSKYAPWIDDDYITQAKLRDDLHSKAKYIDSQEEW